MNLLTQIRRIERIDQLIRLKATGTPNNLAKRLTISRRTLYNILDFMKGQGAEIYYSTNQQSFCYKHEVYFYFGFSKEKKQLKQITGGRQYFFTNFTKSAEFLHYQSLDLYQQRC